MTKQKGAEEGLGSIDMYGQMENPSAYPEVVYQPVMCQQCNHAPCETVCPVAATNHSNEGLNQMAYNRCIGTRYCANNCPYKVRRFNWFNYVGDAKFTEVNPSQNDLARMVLNPDVVVRSRGVMEKCSFCVQRIQAGKLEAKKAGRPVVDGDVVSAGADACPTNAIQFGDVNDKNSTVAHNIADDRSYNMLEEIGVKPNVWYMTKVRNIDEHRLNETVAENPHAGHSADHGHDHEEAHAHGTETEEHNHAH
jgi:molybdopterin-containing oxidoreductase family iron-sulfur binding subunit